MYEQKVLYGEQLRYECTFNDDNARFGLVGKDMDGNPMFIPVSEELMSKHMLFLGGIGSGKSNGMNFVVKNVLTRLTEDDVAIIFDTKGDFYREFYRPGDVVISNDERACGPDGPDYWNVFNEVLADERTEENILEIALNLFSEKIENTTQPFFPNAAKDLFAAVMTHICRGEAYGKFRNNQSLRNFFDHFSVGNMIKVLDHYADLQAMKSYIQDEKSGQTLGVVSELQQAVRQIFVGNFKKSGTLSMRNLVRNRGGKVIFVEYDLRTGSMLTPIYRLLIDLAIKETLSRKEGEKGSVYFFIDEFRLLPHLDHIDDGVNFGRSLGAKFCIAIQNVQQVTAAYGEDKGKSILSGFGTTFGFRVNDAISREYIKSLYGRNSKLQTFQSVVSNRGVAEQIREGFVIEDEDITRLPVGRAIVAPPGAAPFVFHFNKYVKKD